MLYWYASPHKLQEEAIRRRSGGISGPMTDGLHILVRFGAVSGQDFNVDCRTAQNPRASYERKLPSFAAVVSAACSDVAGTVA
jgi:hypothetical protein